MSKLKYYLRQLEESEAIRQGHLLEFLAQERKRKLAAVRRSQRKTIAGCMKVKKRPQCPRLSALT